MLKFAVLVLLVVSTLSCASRQRMKAYEEDIDVIRDEVRTIRKMTDEMHTELGNLRKSMEVVDESVKKQTADIEEQKGFQERLKEIVGNIKDTVVKLESERLPAKREELGKIRDENVDDIIFEDGLIVKTETEDGITKVYTEKSPRDVPAVKKREYKLADTYELADKKIGFGYAVKDGVILWQSPSKNSDVLEILVSWQQLTLTGKVKNDGMNWWRVKTNDYTGYVNARFVIVSE